MPPRPDPARAAALDLLMQVLDEGRALSELTATTAKLSASERATAQRLAADVLRGLDRCDRLLKPHLRKRPALRTQNILRLGVAELAQGGAAHGVVDAAVKLAEGDRRSASAKGMVNAILRKMAEEAPATWGKMPVPMLPKWLRGPLREAWGDRTVAQMEKAHFAGAPLDLTAKGDPAKLAEATGGELLPTGTVRLHQRGQVSALPGFEAGDFWVQDAAAALPARLLGDVAGLKVLDMCAAPGGKTLQLAAAGAQVTALDISEHRLARVHENLGRTGLSAEVIACDVMEHEGQYDAILLDAPCSATGTIRRHPDLPHVTQGERIADLIGLQEVMLDHALHLLKPGGKLVFATCSLIPDEGECQVEEALTRHADLTVLPPEAPGIEPAWITEEGGLRLRPDIWAEKGGMDGFYMALMRKGDSEIR
ncbi:RsmB/NOP family class I SAM-dependent RNA methyltransferase [Allosediminivita pacifica]|uniref:16S rRNA (Cytosine967-C5)-methyltransferase n=1 Tax=Allosediminivita pacifica TaxID=1267769 RepID=A0A2T6B9Y9_9RHOB|nr:transcription antitermination factor NusB [Allosediminivita pacifica]PTX52887.1 16S rRNA (cytosine967-C5)-methyltransferase [Allosediminivita pacifica]GGA94856.1 16S rRNA methyltransferase [Allosediminivita pacifica]